MYHWNGPQKASLVQLATDEDDDFVDKDELVLEGLGVHSSGYETQADNGLGDDEILM
jgi:hypothetical protein